MPLFCLSSLFSLLFLSSCSVLLLIALNIDGGSPAWPSVYSICCAFQRATSIDLHNDNSNNNERKNNIDNNNDDHHDHEKMQSIKLSVL